MEKDLAGEEDDADVRLDIHLKHLHFKKCVALDFESGYHISDAKGEKNNNRAHPTDYSRKPNLDVNFQGDTAQMQEMVYLR